MLAFLHEARRRLRRAPREQMGRSGKARRLVLRGLAPFFSPSVPLPGAACAQTTKAACSAASGGAGVTADSGALGDSSGTLCELESSELTGFGKDRKSGATPWGFDKSALTCAKIGGTPRVVCLLEEAGPELVCSPFRHLA